MVGNAVQMPKGALLEWWRRKWPAIMLATMLGLVLALLGLAAVLSYYVATSRLMIQPAVAERTTSAVLPQRLFSFPGVANPVGIAVSHDGQRIYVAEGGGDRLIKAFDREGRLVGQTAPPGTDALTRRPVQLAVDAMARLYAVDRLRAVVDRYAPTLSWEGEWHAPGVRALGGWLPNGISIARGGRVYIADLGQDEHSVLVLTAEGLLVDRLSKRAGLPGGLNYPVQAVADDEGRIYVSDGNAGRVLAVTPRGTTAVSTAGKSALGLPRGLAVGLGKLFVTDAATNRVAVFALGDRLEYLGAFGDGNDEAALAYPTAVAVDWTGRVYVADWVNRRVQVWGY